MKKRVFLLSALACALFTFTGCSDDDDPVGVNWGEVLPSDQVVVGDNLSVNFNGEVASTGSVKFTVGNGAANAATVSLAGIVPGYGELNVPVTLSQTAENAYAFNGSLAVTSAPAMMRMANAGYVIYGLNVNGSIVNSKCTINVTSVLSEEAQGNLTGTWNLLDKGVVANNVYTSAPLMMTWTANDPSKPNMQIIASLAAAVGSPVLFNLLENVTFHADGNITASYYTPQESENVLDFMGGSVDNGDDSYSYNVIHAGDWSKSQKNLAFWYAKDGYVYITPNISAILGATGMGDIDLNTDLVKTLVESLAGQLGLDAEKLMEVLVTWNQTGIPVKYAAEGNSLSLSIDKEMAAPIIELLLPALPKLQAMYEDMLVNDPDTAQMLGVLLVLMNATSFEDIADIWNTNTKEFGISLNFTK